MLKKHNVLSGIPVTAVDKRCSEMGESLDIVMLERANLLRARGHPFVSALT